MRYAPRIRSALFVPAGREDFLTRAADRGADAVILDLEDGVDLSRKEEARRSVARALETVDFGEREVMVRLNGPGSAFFPADLEALRAFPRFPDTLMLPKVDSPAHLAEVSDALDRHGIACGLIPCVESAAGVLAAPEIARASGRNTGLMFGGFDFSADIGAAPHWEAQLHARSRVVLAAAAARIEPIDSPYDDYHDPDTLAELSRRARRLGFTGKCAIHPAQLDVINQAFSPTPEEVAHARRVVEAARAQGSGAIAVDGKMVDMAVVRIAQRTVALAERIGL